jgi:CheY-like chemotaxis protein
MLTPDVLLINDRALDSQSTLVALEQVAPRAKVLHLVSGEEALEYLFATGEFRGRSPKLPGLVLLSLELRHVSGLCVLDLMRAHPLTRRIPVVLLGLEGDIRKYRRHNQYDADAYVLQPCNFERHCSLMRGCVGHWLPWALRPGQQRKMVALAADRLLRQRPLVRTESCWLGTSRLD